MRPVTGGEVEIRPGVQISTWSAKPAFRSRKLNVSIEGFMVDACRPRAWLVVELQSWKHHAHRQAFERDNERLGRLQVAGYSVLPLTYRQLRDQRDWVIRSVGGLLGAEHARALPSV